MSLNEFSDNLNNNIKNNTNKNKSSYRKIKFEIFFLYSDITWQPAQKIQPASKKKKNDTGYY